MEEEGARHEDAEPDDEGIGLGTVVFYVFCGLLLVGLALVNLWMLGAEEARVVRLARHGARTTAVAVASTGRLAQAVVAFETVDGRSVRSQLADVDGTPDLLSGDRVAIAYDRARPQRPVFAGRLTLAGHRHLLWALVVILGVGGLGVAAIVGPLVSFARARRPPVGDQATLPPVLAATVGVAPAGGVPGEPAPGRPWWRELGVTGLFMIGLLLVGGAVLAGMLLLGAVADALTWMETSSLRDHGVRVPALVVEAGSEERPAVVRFTTADGQEVRARIGRHPDEATGIPVGRRVDVLYSRSDSRVFVLASSTDRSSLVGLLVDGLWRLLLALVFGLATLGMLGAGAANLKAMLDWPPRVRRKPSVPRAAS